MLYGIMPLRNQDKVKLNRCIFSIQRAYNNMINKQFKLIIFRDNDNSELPKIMFPHTVLESKVNKHILYGRLSMLELVKDDDYWFAIDSDDEISEDFLCNIEKEMDSNLDLITTSTIMDNGIVTKYITLNDIFINAYLHGLVFKKSIMKKNDIKLLYDLNDDYEFVDYGEDVIINMINIPNVKSFKHINGVYYYHNEDWFDIEFISKKYPKSEKIKFRRILEQLGYLYPNITTILYYSRKDINALWTDYGIELNPLISTITYEDVNVEKSLVDDKHRIEEAPNLRLVVPYIKNKGDLADKIISLIINIMYCCKQHTKFIVTNSGELQHNSIIGDDWLSYFFEPITMDFSDKFMNEYKLDRIRDIYVKKSHKAYNEIYKSFFKINKRVTDSLVKKNIDYDNTTAIILRSVDYEYDSTQDDKYISTILDELKFQTENVFVVTKDKCLLEKILNKYPKAIYYEQMRVDYKNGYSNVNMSDEDFALMNCQHLFQLEEAAKCKYIKSVDCSDGKLVSIITENQFEYL